MKILIFDVMLDGRFVCTLRYKYHPAVPVSVGKLIDFCYKQVSYTERETIQDIDLDIL